jgi:IS30 family transposase
VDERSRVGDWKMDLIIGTPGGSVLMTAVERKTQLTLIALAPNKTAEAVKNAILETLSLLAAEIKTLRNVHEITSGIYEVTGLTL